MYGNEQGLLEKSHRVGIYIKEAGKKKKVLAASAGRILLAGIGRRSLNVFPSSSRPFEEPQHHLSPDAWSVEGVSQDRGRVHQLVTASTPRSVGQRPSTCIVVPSSPS